MVGTAEIDGTLSIKDSPVLEWYTEDHAAVTPAVEPGAGTVKPRPAAGPGCPPPGRRTGTNGGALHGHADRRTGWGTPGPGPLRHPGPDPGVGPALPPAPVGPRGTGTRLRRSPFRCPGDGNVLVATLHRAATDRWFARLATDIESVPSDVTPSAPTSWEAARQSARLWSYTTGQPYGSSVRTP